MAHLRKLLFLVFIGLLNLYLGLEYASFRINVPFLYVTKIESTFASLLSTAPSSKISVPAQVEHIPLCAVSREEELCAQSKNQTIQTTNLLLTCPGLADAIQGDQKNTSFILQLSSYLRFQLQQPGNKRLAWLFFLKSHNILYTHTPRSLEKFLPPASTKFEALFLGNNSTEPALGLFAIRVDRWGADLLKSVLHLLEERPGLTDNKALELTLRGSNDNKAAYVPQWWLDIGSSCVEESTWEARFGISYIATIDQLYCINVPCLDAIKQTAEKAKLEAEQSAGMPKVLNGDSGTAVEHAIQDTWKFGQYSPWP